MTLRDQLLSILERSRAAELCFIDNLSEKEMATEGTFEKWSAKDNVAHVNYWANECEKRVRAFLAGVEPESQPQFDQANEACFEMFTASSWEEVKSFAAETHAQMVAAVQGLDDEVLRGPSTTSDERKMWNEIVGSAYDHKLIHYAQFYQDHGQGGEASRLWSEWAEQVSSLDAGPEWQGRVHYNAACSLALAGDCERAIEALRTSLELQPNLATWSRLDNDLASLREIPAYRNLIAPVYWWEALEAGPQAEALADQFLRALRMFRGAISECPAAEWREGETLYLRPSGLALHIVQTIDLFSALKLGDRSDHPLTQVDWEIREGSKLPVQDELLGYLDMVEERFATFLANSDFQAEEELFVWTGSTVLSRAIYALRHTQHHLADMAMELQRRGFQPPSWQ
jgi:tetratricopeptide (TPR) repeat protein